MILFYGIPSEPPIARAIQAARDGGVEHVVLNQRRLGDCDLVVDCCGAASSGVLATPDGEFPLERFRGAYVRPIELRDLPESRSASAAEMARIEFVHQLLATWFEVANCRVVNRARPATSNMSKPYQAQLIAAAGFATPPTLVTNDVTAVRDFQRRHGRVIYKSISAVRSIVRELTPRHDPAVDRLADLPTQFQARIPGEDVRVHVIDREVFATRIRSGATDYRYAGEDGCDVTLEPTTLPAAIEERCRGLARRLQLPFCGIDLRETDAGEFYCFEVNPSPAYSYYEDAAGQPIAAALVEYLAADR